jgi:hypothetical protein
MRRDVKCDCDGRQMLSGDSRCALFVYSVVKYVLVCLVGLCDLELKTTS